MAEKSNAAAEREAAKKAQNSLPERDSYTAKQVAARCGTDAKTLRKFLRSSHSTAEAVGQGGRYEFDADDLPLIKKEFGAWRKKAEARKSNQMTKLVDIKPSPKIILPEVEHEDLAHHHPDEDEDREPTAEELAELEKDLPPW